MNPQWPSPLNQTNQMDGLALPAELEPVAIPAYSFNLQYRGVLDKINYSNEGKSRG